MLYLQERQTLIRRRRPSQWRVRAKSLFSLMAAAALCVLAAAGLHRGLEVYAQLPLHLVAIDGLDTVPRETRQGIEADIATYLRSAPPPTDLLAQAGWFQRLRDFLRQDDRHAIAQVIRTELGRFRIRVTPRHPVLEIVEGEDHTWIDDEGTSFSALLVPPTQGVPTLVLDPDTTLSVDVRQEVLELIRVASQAGYRVSHLAYAPYRGFRAKVDGFAGSIVLGRAPFHIKFRRLSNLLSRPRGGPIEEVELDFDAKAYLRFSSRVRPKDKDA